jgi:hypothetical protein
MGKKYMAFIGYAPHQDAGMVTLMVVDLLLYHESKGREGSLINEVFHISEKPKWILKLKEQFGKELEIVEAQNTNIDTPN